MTDREFTTLRYEVDGPVATVTIDRPEVRNAFDETTIAELARAFERVAGDDAVRVMVLAGGGEVFCAGDLNWMRRVAAYSYDENLEDARVFAKMIESLYRLPKPTIAAVQGACMGGGVGLVCACDVVVAVREARFALREILLGIAPATIAPYVLRRMGERYAHDYFLTGRSFDAERAREIGVVDDVVEREALAEHVARRARLFLRAAPGALRETKALIDRVANRPIEAVQDDMARTIARLRCADEGQEGFAAFFEKRRPAWAPGED